MDSKRHCAEPDCTAANQRFFLPATVLPSNLSTSINALQQYLVDPPSRAVDPKNLLRKARPRRDDADRQPRQRKVIETQVYKSAAFIEDSDDDDEEANRRFFARERLLRLEMDYLAMQSRNTMRESGTKRKRKAKEGGVEQVGTLSARSADDSSPAKTPDADSDSVEASQVNTQGHEGESDGDSSDGGLRRRQGRRTVLDSDSE